MTEAPERMLVTEDGDNPSYENVEYVRADLVDWISVEEQAEPNEPGYYEVWLSPNNVGRWAGSKARPQLLHWPGGWDYRFVYYEITHWRHVRGPHDTDS